MRVGWKKIRGGSRRVAVSSRGNDAEADNAISWLHDLRRQFLAPERFALPDCGSTQFLSCASFAQPAVTTVRTAVSDLPGQPCTGDPWPVERDAIRIF
jgi:hypothetical protein